MKKILNLFKKAKKDLEKNPSEGQVEKSVVIPLLEMLGYDDIQSKVTVITYAGRKKFKTQADIIAYDKKLPTIVVDAKSPKIGINIIDDLGQVCSYANSRSLKKKAEFVILSSGYVTHLYDVSTETLLLELDLKDLFQSIDKIMRFLKGMEKPKEKPTLKDLDNLFIRSLNEMFKQAIKPTPALKIMTQLLLIKISEEKGRSISKLKDILEFEKKYYESETSQEDREEIDNLVYTHINKSLAQVSSDLLDEEDRTFSRQIPSNTLFIIVKDIYNYNLSSIDVDIKGRAFELFLDKTLVGKELGQYFTPRTIVDFIVDAVNIKISDLILDPACGTGGFLKKAFITIAKKINEQYNYATEEYKEKKKFLHSSQIHGLDLDYTAVKLCKINLWMHGDGHTLVHRGDGLQNYGNLVTKEKFNLIITNPPFGRKKSVQIKIKDIPNAEEWDLTYKRKYNAKEDKYIKTGKLLDSQAKDILFIERCIKLLRPDGRLAIILPDGVFNNINDAYIRQYLFNNLIIQAVIKISDEAFIPYGTGEKTSILFARKKKFPDEKQGDIFMAVANHVGYDKNKNKDANDLEKYILPELKKFLRGK